MFIIAESTGHNSARSVYRKDEVAQIFNRREFSVVQFESLPSEMSDSKQDQEERIPGTEDYHEDVNNDEYYDGEEDYGDATNQDDPELEEMKKRVQEMEEEQEKLTKLQHQVEKDIHSATDSIDENSV